MSLDFSAMFILSFFRVYHRFSQSLFGITFFRVAGSQIALKRGIREPAACLCVITNDAYNLFNSKLKQRRL